MATTQGKRSTSTWSTPSLTGESQGRPTASKTRTASGAKSARQPSRCLRPLDKPAPGVMKEKSGRSSPSHGRATAPGTLSLRATPA
eukprot:12164758-Heterocapsa_arctica.AAC.1